MFNCSQQNWIAFNSLPSKLLAKQKFVDFPNNDLPKAGYHNAYCEVNHFKPLLVQHVTSSKITCEWNNCFLTKNQRQYSFQFLGHQVRQDILFHAHGHSVSVSQLGTRIWAEHEAGLQQHCIMGGGNKYNKWALNFDIRGVSDRSIAIINWCSRHLRKIFGNFRKFLVIQLNRCNVKFVTRMCNTLDCSDRRAAVKCTNKKKNANWFQIQTDHYLGRSWTFWPRAICVKSNPKCIAHITRSFRKRDAKTTDIYQETMI